MGENFGQMSSIHMGNSKNKTISAIHKSIILATEPQILVYKIN